MKQTNKQKQTNPKLRKQATDWWLPDDGNGLKEKQNR